MKTIRQDISVQEQISDDFTSIEANQCLKKAVDYSMKAWSTVGELELDVCVARTHPKGQNWILKSQITIEEQMPHEVLLSIKIAFQCYDCTWNLLILKR